MKIKIKWLRLRGVCRVTGWDRWYVRKLVSAGVLHEHKPLPGGRAWYSADEVAGVAGPASLDDRQCLGDTSSARPRPPGAKLR